MRTVEANVHGESWECDISLEIAESRQSVNQCHDEGIGTPQACTNMTAFSQTSPYDLRSKHVLVSKLVDKWSWVRNMLDFYGQLLANR